MSTVILTTVLAGLLAGILALLDFIALKFPKTSFLVMKCPGLYLYALVYAIFAVAVMVTYEYVAPHDGPHSPLGANLWLRMFLVGFFLNSFLHTRILTLPGVPEPTIVSLDRMLLRFEPHLLSWISQHAEAAEVNFVDRHASSYYVDLVKLKEIISANLPIDMSPNDQSGFLATIEQTDLARRCAILYLRLVGRRRFLISFPATVTALAA